MPLNYGVPLNRDWIAAHIPHRGRMCLLDEVLDWSSEHIRCRSATHRAPDNPLRSAHGLGVACGIEYAAQAMALHGALLGADAQGSSEAGFLGSVRDVHFFVRNLDRIESDLICEVAHLAGDRFSALYAFALMGDECLLLKGRASVLLDAGRRLKHE